MIQLLAVGPMELTLLAGVIAIVAILAISRSRKTLEEANHQMRDNLYDPLVLEAEAKTLLRRASQIVAFYAISGIVAGLSAAILASTLGAQNEVITVGSLLFPILIFITIGASRAAALRFQAQSLLCQLQIEKNTRATAEALVGARLTSSSPGPRASQAA